MKKFFTFLFTTFIVVSFYTQSWVPRTSPYPYLGINILTLDTPTSFWSVSNNKVAKTTDGGNTWTTVNLTTIEAAYSQFSWGLSSISSIDNNTAWLMTLHGSNMFDIWKTSDGGSTWVHQLDLSPGSATTVHFFNANVGIAIANPIGNNYRFRIHRTTDGGATWTLLPDSSSPEAKGVSKQILLDVNGELFFREEHIIPGGQFRQKIIKTSDQGLTWSALPAEFMGRHNIMSWSAGNKGIMVEQTVNDGSTMVFKRTTDGGQTWSVLPFTGLPLQWITDIVYVPGTNILLATGQYATFGTTNQGSWRSLDNGATWTAIDPGVLHNQIRCYAVGVCYAIGFDLTLNQSTVDKMTFSELNTEDLNTPTFGIYPNPTYDELNIKTSNKILNTTLFDLSGKIVLTGISKKLDLSSLPKGVYLLNIEFKDGTSVSEKVIKK